MLLASLTSEPDTERIEAVSIDGGQRSVVIERATTPVWSPTGHLLFARDGAVLAVPFDTGTATTRGAAVPVIRSGTIETVLSGCLGFWMSSTGTLVYQPRGFIDNRLVVVARNGATEALDLPSGSYTNPRIAPGGRRLLVESASSSIESLDLARGTRSRLTFAAIGTLFSTWTSDGSRVVFRRFNLPFWVTADGSADPIPLPAAAFNDFSLGARTESRLCARPPHPARVLGGRVPDVGQRCPRAEAADRYARLRGWRAAVTGRSLADVPIERLRTSGP